MQSLALAMRLTLIVRKIGYTLAKSNEIFLSEAFL